MAGISSLLLLSGCSQMIVLHPHGPIAAEEKNLMLDALALMAIVVIPVLVLTVVLSIKYRASNKKAKYSPNWSHAHWLEAGWWAIPIAIIAVLATMTWRETHALDPYKPLDSHVPPVTIQVVALQWRWLFIYPQQNIATINFVEFPVHTPIDFLVTADAPMNSFQIQGLAGQIYAMDGMQTKLHLIATDKGDYIGRSTNFSGDGFSNMVFTARAVSTADFNQWVKTTQQGKGEALSLPLYHQVALATRDTSVHYYPSVAQNLFHDIIMSYMMPMKNTHS
jgi:cytochrome o ubiquinol oxidase subunit 2